MNPITMQLVADKYIKMALEEDINSEDVSTNAVMPEYKKGDVQLICKEDGIIAGLQIFERVFTLLDEKTQVYETMTVVTRNHEAKEAYAAVQGKEPEGYSWEYALDLIGDAGEQITVGDEIETILTESSFNGWVEVREKERNTVYSLYGSLLFLGVFVGALFLMGAVMIIYYKQVSEGFDDRKRFQIMQKVGMSRKEIRQTIQSQVVTVFFMPLAVAVVHTMVAFPLTRRIMAMLNFPDSNLFLAATAITIAAFAVVYLIVYVLTARAYYKNTVFEVVSLDVKSATADKVVFTVKAKRGGELLEQPRSIELTLTGGIWTVTGEGY